MPLRVKKMMREKESKIQSGACPSALSNELAAPSSAPTQTTNPDERERVQHPIRSWFICASVHFCL